MSKAIVATSTSFETIPSTTAAAFLDCFAALAMTFNDVASGQNIGQMNDMAFRAPIPARGKQQERGATPRWKRAFSTA
jgi:hypothetical protein